MVTGKLPPPFVTLRPNKVRPTPGIWLRFELGLGLVAIFQGAIGLLPLISETLKNILRS